MKKFLVLVICVCVVSAVTSAATIGGIGIDLVTISNPGNVADSNGFGSVNYEYQIGKYEITNNQWETFVSAVGAPTGNLSNAYGTSAYWTDTNVPVNAVSWYEAAQFCNYLTSGDKSRGAYQFSGTNAAPGDFLGIDRASSISAYGITYVIPNENEWYKAAYYKPDGSGYSLFANGQDNIPTPDDGWNFFGGTYSSPWNVGTGTEEQNGTFDMMGNVWELNENEFESNRVIRGGSFSSMDKILGTSVWNLVNPANEYGFVGFRVAAVPEPFSLVLLGLGGLVFRLRKI